MNRTFAMRQEEIKAKHYGINSLTVRCKKKFANHTRTLREGSQHHDGVRTYEAEA